MVEGIEAKRASGRPVRNVPGLITEWLRQSDESEMRPEGRVTARLGAARRKYRKGNA